MKLYVHIGCPKGGSSALQQFCRINAPGLRTQGFHVLSRDLLPEGIAMGNQNMVFRQLSQGDVVAADVRASILALRDEADAAIISAEVLSSTGATAGPLFADLVAEGIDVRVLMYVRRQDEFLESAWQQWAQKSGNSLLHYLVGAVGRQADWAELLEPWQQHLGVDRIAVRRYGSAYFVRGSIFADFCDFLGADLAVLETPERRVNETMSFVASNLANGTDSLFDGPHDDRFHSYLQTYGGKAVRKSSYDYSPLTPAERRAIIARYGDSNERLRTTFLPGLEAPLFDLPPDVPTAGPPGLEASVASLQEQIFGLYADLKDKGVL